MNRHLPRTRLAVLLAVLAASAGPAAAESRDAGPPTTDAGPSAGAWQIPAGGSATSRCVALPGPLGTADAPSVVEVGDLGLTTDAPVVSARLWAMLDGALPLPADLAPGQVQARTPDGAWHPFDAVVTGECPFNPDAGLCSPELTSLLQVVELPSPSPAAQRFELARTGEAAPPVVSFCLEVAFASGAPAPGGADVGALGTEDAGTGSGADGSDEAALDEGSESGACRAVPGRAGGSASLFACLVAVGGLVRRRRAAR